MTFEQIRDKCEIAKGWSKQKPRLTGITTGIFKLIHRDIPALLDIAEAARDFMAEANTTKDWGRVAEAGIKLDAALDVVLKRVPKKKPKPPTGWAPNNL